ncbi:MAG: hypothetical protein KBT46_05520, partial [Ruminococcus sp.]|nr:hypothetical protein [Candidatus Copronaster equi]
MNILLMTTSMKQPDDRDASKTDVVFYFAQEWAKAGHRVVVIHNEAKFPYILYKLPMSIYKKAFGTRSVNLPSVASRKKLRRQQDGVEILRLPMRKFIPHSSYAEFQYKSQIKKVKAFLNDIDFKPDVITGHWFEPQLRMIHDLGKFYSAKT